MISEPQPVLKLITYGKALLDRIDTIGGSRNQTVERAVESQTIAWVMAAFLPGEWLSIVNVDERTAISGRLPLVPTD